MNCPGREALESWSAGEALAERAAAIEAHAGQCAACQQKLAWMCREKEAIRAWAAPGETDVERLWSGVRQRIAPRRSPRWLAPAGAGVAAVLALLSLTGLRHEREEEPQTRTAMTALASAESEYATAVAALEAQVAARHPPVGRHAGALDRTRSGLLAARISAGNEPGARVRVLEGYAAYLKSLRRALQDDQP